MAQVIGDPKFISTMAQVKIVEFSNIYDLLAFGLRQPFIYLTLTSTLTSFDVKFGGGGSNNKKDHAAGKNLRCPLSFLFFFVLFQNTFKIDVFVSNLVKNMSSKKNKKDHDFRIF